MEPEREKERKTRIRSILNAWNKSVDSHAVCRTLYNNIIVNRIDLYANFEYGDANKYRKVHILVVNGYRHIDLFIMVWRSVNMKCFHLLGINGVAQIDQICSFCSDMKRGHNNTNEQMQGDQKTD